MPLLPTITAEECLTLEQIEELPDRTLVDIKWTGGNGPWTYQLEKTNDGSILARSVLSIIRSPGHIIDFVGDKKPFTMVRISKINDELQTAIRLLGALVGDDLEYATYSDGRKISGFMDLIVEGDDVNAAIDFLRKHGYEPPKGEGD